MKIYLGLLPLFWLVLSCAGTPPSSSLLEGLTLTPEKDWTSEISTVVNHAKGLIAEESAGFLETWVKTTVQGLPWVSGTQTLFILAAPEGTEFVALGGDLLAADEPVRMLRAGNSALWFLVVDGLSGWDYKYIFFIQTASGMSLVTDPHSVFLQGGRTLRSRVWAEPAGHGKLVLIKKEEIPAFPEGMPARDVWIYLPPGYTPEGTERYPVMYWADGQNLWENEDSPWGGWKLDITSDRLVVEGKIPAIIHVGITNSRYRSEEYMGLGIVNRATGAPDAEALTKFQAHTDWLIKGLKPWIDASYRTQPSAASTGAGGSSAGGCWAPTMALTHPEVFGRAAGLSVAGAWPEGEEPKVGTENTYRNFQGLLAGIRGRKPQVVLWLDCGTEELDAELLWGARFLRDGLVGKGFSLGRDLFYEEVAGTGHNERVWAERLDRILISLWPVKPE